MDGPEAIRAARALVPMLRERAAAADAQRRMSSDTMSALVDAGMFRLVQPRRFGGHQLGAEVFVEVMVEIARGDGSAGWITSLTSAHTKWAGFFPIEGQEEMYGANQDLRFPLVVAPQGRAIPTAGGHLLEGAWDYVSGCDVCNWLCVNAVVPTSSTDATPQGLVSAVIASADYRVEDNWHVDAMRGTGSKRAVVEEILVPDRRVIALDSSGEPATRDVLDRADEGFYRMPMVPLFAVELGAVAVGIGRGFLELFVDRARTKTSPFPPFGRMADSEAVQRRLGQATGAIDNAARALAAIARDYDARAAADAGHDDVEVRRALVGVQGLVLDVCAAVESLGTVAGTSIIREGEALMRAWRDLIAVRTHYLLDRDRTALNLGRLALDLGPVSRN